MDLPRGMDLPGGGGYLPRYCPPVNRMTDRCKNITLPQTLFAGDKNDIKTFSRVNLGQE